MLSGHEVDKDVLASRVERPVDFSPAHMDLIRASFAERVLPEKEHVTSAVLIHRPALLFHQAGTFYYIHELNLFMAGELRKGKSCQLFTDCLCDAFCEDIAVVVNRGVMRKKSRIRFLVSSIRLWLLFFSR